MLNRGLLLAGVRHGAPNRFVDTSVRIIVPLGDKNVKYEGTYFMGSSDSWSGFPNPKMGNLKIFSEPYELGDEITLQKISVQVLTLKGVFEENYTLAFTFNITGALRDKLKDDKGKPYTLDFFKIDLAIGSGRTGAGELKKELRGMLADCYYTEEKDKGSGSLRVSIDEIGEHNKDFERFCDEVKRLRFSSGNEALYITGISAKKLGDS